MLDQIALALAIEIGKKAVDKFFEGKGKQDTDVVGVGLAVGYFYNFLDPVSDVIERDELEVFTSSSPSPGSGQKFSAENIRVQVIVPQRLNVNAFQRCEAEFKNRDKGFIYMSQNKRYYGINYALTTSAARTELTIVDLARPIMSAKRYYEEIIKMDVSDTNDKWQKIQVAELTAFQEALRRLQQRGYGALVNKMDFLERG